MLDDVEQPVVAARPSTSASAARTASRTRARRSRWCSSRSSTAPTSARTTSSASTTTTAGSEPRSPARRCSSSTTGPRSPLTGERLLRTVQRTARHLPQEAPCPSSTIRPAHTIHDEPRTDTTNDTERRATASAGRPPWRRGRHDGRPPLVGPGARHHRLRPAEPVRRAVLAGRVGPSAVVAARGDSHGARGAPEGFQVSLSDTARAIGLGAGTGRQAPINRTIDRACMFGAMRRVSERRDARPHAPAAAERTPARPVCRSRCATRTTRGSRNRTSPGRSTPTAAGGLSRIVQSSSSSSSSSSPSSAPQVSSRCSSVRTPKPGAALGVLAVGLGQEGRAGDVEVHPRGALGDELLQEQPCGECAAVAAGADVLEVRDRASPGRPGSPPAAAGARPARRPPLRPPRRRLRSRRRCPSDRRSCAPSATMQAPVSVARSMIASGSSSEASTSASARTSRPSASVLSTSIVVPLRAV